MSFQATEAKEKGEIKYLFNTGFFHIQYLFTPNVKVSEYFPDETVF